MIKKLKFKNKYAKHFFLLSIVTLIVKGLGFLKEIMIADYFGTSIELDMLLLSLNFTGTILLIFSNGIESTLLPNYLKFKNINQEMTNSYLFTFFIILILINIFIYFFMIFFSNDIIKIIAPGFSSQSIIQTNVFLKIFVWFLIFSFLSSFFIAILKAENKFLYAGSVPALISLSIIILLFFFHSFGVIIIAYAFIIGSILQLIFLLSKTMKYLSYKNIIISKLKVFYKDIIKNYFILISSGLFIGLIGLTDQSFATLAGQGAVSSLNYAQKFPALIESFLVMVLGTIMFTKFSENNAHKKYELNKKLYIKTMKFIFIITILISLILSYFSKTIIEILFLHGKFNLKSLYIVYPVQTIFLLKLPFITLSVLSARMMNSFELNSQMLYINIISFLLNLILDYVLVVNYGLIGIAYSTLFVYILATILNHYVVIKHFNRIVRV